MEDSGDLDFSMSGLKTAVLRYVRAEQAAGRDVSFPDVAASFQEAIVDVQVSKTVTAAKDKRVDTVLLGGGVVANTQAARADDRSGGAGGTSRALPVARPVHGQRGDDRDGRGGQARSGGTVLAGHRRRPQPKVGAVTTVLVTGGAGFIGSQLAERLLAEGHRVISVDDLSTGKIANLVEARGYGKEFSFFNMDVRAEGLASQFERHRPEVVFHLAAQAGVRPSLTDPVHDASVNIMGLLNVLEASVHIGARKVIYAASGGTMYGEPRRLPTKETAAQGSRPLSPYGVSKKVALDYLSYFQRYRGLDYTALGLANVYGPRQDPTGEAGVVAIFASKMLTGEAPTIFGDGNQTRDFVFIDDTVHAFVQAMDRGSGKLVNIGTGLGDEREPHLQAVGRPHRIRR